MAVPVSSQAPPLTLKQQTDALRDGKILGWECAKCGRRTLTPVTRCTCGSKVLRTKEFATTGTVVTYTIQHVAAEQFLNEVPFAWAIVALDDGGPNVSGWIPFIAKPSDLAIGQKVKFTPGYKPGMMFEKT